MPEVHSPSHEPIKRLSKKDHGCRWRGKVRPALKWASISAWSCYFFYYSVTKRFDRNAGKPNRDANEILKGGYRSPFYSWDMLYTIIGAFILEGILYFFIHPRVEAWYMENLDDTIQDKRRHDTAIKASLTVNQFIKATILTVWGFWVLSDELFTPKLLGGQGSSAFFVAEMPYAVHVYPTHQMFYPAVLLRYIMDFIYFPLRKRVLPKDFKVMCYHHVVTIHLILGSYILDYANAGAVAMHLHNISEPLLCLCRLSNSVPIFDRYQLDIVFWALMTASWGYLRLIVWPKDFVWPFAQELYLLWTREESVLGFNYVVACPWRSGHSTTIFWTLLSFTILQIMHVHWFIIFIKIATNAIMRGVKSDAISDHTQQLKRD